MLQADSIIYGAFAAYLLLMLAIGVVAWLRTRNLSDYLLGGRKLGPLAAALSAGASDMSGWLLLGLPGFAYAAGLESIWIGLGLLIGTWCNWRFLAARLRQASVAYGNALTIPSYLRNRFGDNSGVLSISSSLFILLFFLFYTASALVAGGKLFETVFQLPYHLAVWVGVLAIVSYTFFGGFLAVSWTDMVQGLLMLAALLLVPVIAWTTLDAPLAQEYLFFFDPFVNADGQSLGWVAVVSSMAWGLGYFGQPHILARFKAIESVDAVPRARRIAVSWTAACLIGACAVGISGRLLFGGDLPDSEKVFMVLVEALFHPLIAGILLAAILAAIMSTADSQLLVSSSVLAEDIYKGLLRPEAKPEELLWVGRSAVLLIAVMALYLALDTDRKVLELVAYAWAGFGAAFGPVLIISVYWSRMTRWGALAGMIGGAATVVVWKQLDGGVYDVYEIVPGVIVATAAVVIVSRLYPETSRT